MPPLPPHARRLITIVIAALLIAVLVFFAFLARSGTLVVTVRNGHGQTAVTYRVYVDGALKDQGSLLPYAGADHTYSLFWLFDPCQVHQVTADSTVGGTGPHGSGKVVTVCGGTSVPVTLTI